MIRTTRRRTSQKNESFDGRIIRSAQDLKSYLKKKGFGDVIIDEDSDNNEVEFFNDEVTLLYDGLEGQIQLEYYEPATASEIVDSLEGSIDEDTDVEDIEDLCRDEAGALSEYTSNYTLDLPVRVSKLESAALDIADRVQKIREEAISDAVDELMDRYGLNR